ncbi:hypothetical protein SAMN05660420_02247 [Desulfuromusa kysingii]|uniref:Ribbon-helix-helix protein, copG family n=1 Tax=Desulfuromusa kysingii TaxID=37625 RepID=A0A1H4BK57_9BACT|nr:hypothetical protein [Desulfuromusa kysingii]SEA48408.1 hypothetical protein SAMN05660420_02247 [Desulfuromusa kysingii]
MANLKSKKDRLERKITFRIDDDRMKQLEQCASFEGMPVSFIVRHLVIRFLESRRTEHILLKGMAGLDESL